MLTPSNMELILMFMFFTGIVFVIVGYIKSKQTCPTKAVEYRFVPRTFKEEQESPVSVHDVFEDMFKKPSPWVGGYTQEYYVQKHVNQNFISQS